MISDIENIWNDFIKPERLKLIAGPCVIESENLCLQIANSLKEMTEALGIVFVFKASFDKANRTSIKSYRGPGLEKGLKILETVKKTFKVPILTDIHTETQADIVAEVADFLQIPAFLCRQTDLILAAAKTGKIVNIKKGQFISPIEIGNAAEKATQTGNNKIILTERGTFFGYNNLVVDMRAFPIMKKFGFPVIFDATHSVQLPGGAGKSSSGEREFAPILARCAIAAGADGLFLETHPDPDNALSDGPNMLHLSKLKPLLAEWNELFTKIKQLT